MSSFAAQAGGEGNSGWSHDAAINQTLLHLNSKHRRQRQSESQLPATLTESKLDRLLLLVRIHSAPGGLKEGKGKDSSNGDGFQNNGGDSDHEIRLRVVSLLAASARYFQCKKDLNQVWVTPVLLFAVCRGLRASCLVLMNLQAAASFSPCSLPLVILYSSETDTNFILK